MTTTDTETILPAVARLRSRMPAVAVDRADRLARVNSIYVNTRRDDALVASFDHVFENIAGTAVADAHKVRAVFVLGEAGSGKTTAIKRLLSKRPELQPYSDEHGYPVVPYISFDAPKPLTLKLLAGIGLREAGYELQRSRQENEMWELFKQQLRFREILLVHIDEMQHVLRGNSTSNVNTIADVMKSFLQIKDWPVHAIFSGVPMLAQFLAQDRQLRERSLTVRYDRLVFPQDTALVQKIVRHIVHDAAAMQTRASIHENAETIARLIHMADGQFGTVIQFVRAVLGPVLRAEREIVGIEDFAATYRALTGCRDDDNVFTADRWHDILPDRSLADLIRDYVKEKKVR